MSRGKETVGEIQVDIKTVKSFLQNQGVFI